LYDVFLHELGHLQVVHADETSERRKFAMETRAQEFAMEWCQRLWSKPFDHPDPVHNIPTKAEFDDHDPELTELERRVRADPENADLHQSLGRLYLRRGRADDAIAAYRESLTLDPSNVWTWLYLGNWYYERGDDESALESFSRAAELMPGNETALWCMANVYERQGLWDLAETHYRKAVALNPTSKTAHRQLKSARRRLAESSS
jgi:tetratricopeptide (TPR) repeat protein